MLTGILFAVAAGTFWSLNGIANSSCARYRLDIVTYLFTNVLFSALITGVLFVRFDQFLTSNTLRLAAVMLPSGFLNTLGALSLQKALQHEHHGIVFLISQSALIVPFLFGVIILREPTNLMRCSGAALIFTGMVFCAIPKISSRPNIARGGRIGLFFALCSFFLMGISQSLMSLPSYWQDFTDASQSRTTLLYTGSLVLMTFTALNPKRPEKLILNKILILLGIVAAVLNALSMRLLFESLDRLAACGMASVVFSLAIASSLLMFTLYSIFILKEKCYKWTIAGLFCIIAGGFLIS